MVCIRQVSKYKVEKDMYELARLCFAMMFERRKHRSGPEPSAVPICMT